VSLRAFSGCGCHSGWKTCLYCTNSWTWEKTHLFSLMYPVVNCPHDICPSQEKYVRDILLPFPHDMTTCLSLVNSQKGHTNKKVGSCRLLPSQITEKEKNNSPNDQPCCLSSFDRLMDGWLSYYPVEIFSQPVEIYMGVTWGSVWDWPWKCPLLIPEEGIGGSILHEIW
jgi:hypothetical protein